jgi:probable HAF family extracellular repeat protein
MIRILALSLLCLTLVVGCGSSSVTSSPSLSSPVASMNADPARPAETNAPTATPIAVGSPVASSPALAPGCLPSEVDIVAADDTLWDIAQRHGVTVEALLAANPQIADRRLIRIGAEITISPVDLGQLNGSHTFAYGVNDHGQVVGRSNVGNSGHAFLWQDGTMTDLGTLGGDSSEARAINEHGQIVGTSRTASGAEHAFLWQDGRMTDLGTLGGETSGAQDINDRGQVVGWSSMPPGDPAASGTEHAVLWQDGTITDLGTLGGGSSEARAINEHDQIVGTSRTASGAGHAFLWQDGRMTDLGTGGAIMSDAYGINDRGQIVGSAWSDSEMAGRQALLWHDGRITDLGTVGWDSAEAFAINESGQIVGWTSVEAVHPGELGGGLSHAFLWRDGTMTDLGTRAGIDTNSWAEAINECGWVVGWGSDRSGGFHALLWYGGAP